MLELELTSLRNDLEIDNLNTSLLTERLGTFEFQNTDDKNVSIAFAHDKSYIHFIFSLEGCIKVSANGLDESVEINQDNFYVFSNPYLNTQLNLELLPSSQVLSIVIHITELHEIFGSSFGKDEQAAKEFIESYKMKRFFIEKEMTPSIAVLVHRFFSGVSKPNLRKIYQHGKVMELLSLYMDKPNSEHEADEACPFVMDALELKKIKEARDIIISDLISPPSLKSLAKLVGTNEFKLKHGFKSVYNNTVYGYLLDYKMEHARKLLCVDNKRIKDVASEIGYSNPSHFIAAYKRRYGVTPKQHLMSQAS
ncbi:MAG: helix-turn-helix transcriptional regulator [Cyclobacteriaceae bacterium]|nr:helix-turn-helix transcriptional regulator [Cyclobacteriaceae bacterium]